MAREALITTVIFLIVIVVLGGVFLLAFGGNITGSTVNEDLRSLQTENQELQNKVTNLEATNIQLLNQINSKPQNTITKDPYYDLDTLRRIYTDDDDECDDLEDDKDDIEEEIDEVEEKIEELEDEIEAKKSQNQNTSDLEEDLEELEDELEELEEELEEVKDDLDDENC